MFTAIFGLAKLGFDFIAGRAIAVFNMRMQIAAFIIDRWRVILPVAILCLSLLYVWHLRGVAEANKARADKSDAALAQKYADDAAEAKKREADNKLNRELAQKKTDAEVAKYKSQLALIISKGKSNEAISNRTITNYRDGLRLAIQREASARVSENDTDRPVSRNGDTAIPRPIHEVEAELKSCKKAGAFCAADFNWYKSYIKIQQDKIGVEE